MSKEYKWPVPCGISVPQIFTETEVDIEFVRRFAKDAEALGYHSLWVQERIIGTANQLEPINLLSFLSGITKTIRLGTAVIVATTRNPPTNCLGVPKSIEFATLWNHSISLKAFGLRRKSATKEHFGTLKS
jgi:hypothetical protein